MLPLFLLTLRQVLPCNIGIMTNNNIHIIIYLLLVLRLAAVCNFLQYCEESIQQCPVHTTDSAETQRNGEFFCRISSLFYTVIFLPFFFVG